MARRVSGDARQSAARISCVIIRSSGTRIRNNNVYNNVKLFPSTHTRRHALKTLSLSWRRSTPQLCNSAIISARARARERGVCINERRRYKVFARSYCYTRYRICASNRGGALSGRRLRDKSGNEPIGRHTDRGGRRRASPRESLVLSRADKKSYERKRRASDESAIRLKYGAGEHGASSITTSPP